MIPLLRHLGLGDHSINLKIIEIAFDPANFLLILQDNALNVFGLAFDDLDAHRFKIPRAVSLVVDLADILFIVKHSL